MKSVLAALAIASAALSACATTQAAPAVAELQAATFYEMRTYYAAPGKFEELENRFRNHTMRAFARHGMVNVAYWKPVDNPENKLVYILAYPSAQAREASWTAFRVDPEWVAAKAASEANGLLVSKVESVFLRSTDYSPAVRVAVTPESTALTAAR